MSDHAFILRAFDHAKASGLPAVLATVVGTSGSTYRKPGARMILVADGTRVGVVSGGCLEADVARRAWFLRSPGQGELVRYDTGTGEDATYEFGLGCRGVVEVLLERLDTSSAAADAPIIRALRDAVDRRQSTDFATFIRGSRIGERVSLGCCRQMEASEEDAIAETIEPPVQLVVIGSGIDTSPVISIANTMGWQTVVVDRKLDSRHVSHAAKRLVARADEWAAALTVDERTAAVVMTHRMVDDGAYLRSLLETDAGYIGCLGPANRAEALFDQLAVEGFVIEQGIRDRIRSPIGLDLGGERPEEIALSIIAEIQADLANASAQHLRDRAGPIHGRLKGRLTPVAAD